MSCCYISKLPEPFKFARFVWNALTSRPVTLDDIFEVDGTFKDFIESVETCNSMEEFENLKLTFVCKNSLDEDEELIPGGSNELVTFERKEEFLQLCRKFRLKEFNAQLEELRSGFNSFFPSSVAAILAPWELELLICGDNQVPVADLKRLCTFSRDEQAIQMLWKVLESFTAEERLLFIKFACGRMGLPPPGSSWGTNIQIIFKANSKPDPMKPLPTATTCASQIIIPRYSTEEWMAKKIRTAITFGADIDQDHRANISEVSQFT